MLSIGKLLVIGAVIVIVYYVFFRGKKTVADKSSKTEKRDDTQKIEETMVECAKCSTFVSQKEAVIKEGSYYCSKECALS